MSEIAADATSEPAAIVNDWEPALHEEIARLPARYRVPMVLCELEGRTHEQAARHLGWPVGTVKSRLARGRLRLRDRLIRRGLAPCGALSVLISSPFEATAAIPPALANSTIWGAKTFATANASTALAGLYSASVAALTKGVLRAMILTKLKIAALGVVSAGIIGTTVGILAGQEPAIKPEGAAVQSKEAKLVSGGGIEKRQNDLVAHATQLARFEVESMSASELQVRAELESLRGELKEQQAILKEAQAQGKKPNEVEIINRDVANLQSEVRREEALLESVQNQLARYQVQATPGDIVAIAVSRSMLREMRDRLLTLRDSMRLDLQQSEQAYRVLRMNGEEKGGSKEQAARSEIEHNKIMFNSIVDQLKAMQFLIDRADLPVRGRPAEKK